MSSLEGLWMHICLPAQVEFAVRHICIRCPAKIKFAIEHIFVHTASRLLFGGAEDGVTRKNLVNPLKMRMDYDY